MKHLPRIVLSLALGLAAVGAWVASPSSGVVEAQQQQRSVWYRIEVRDRTAGTTDGWQRLGEGYAGTFPFMDDFQVTIRPGRGGAAITIRDGRSEVTSAISCTRERAPDKTALVASRRGGDQPPITVGITCSATRPAAH